MYHYMLELDQVCLNWNWTNVSQDNMLELDKVMWDERAQGLYDTSNVCLVQNILVWKLFHQFHTYSRTLNLVPSCFNWKTSCPLCFQVPLSFSLLAIEVPTIFILLNFKVTQHIKWHITDTTGTQCVKGDKESKTGSKTFISAFTWR